MKKIIVLCVALLFLMINGCDKITGFFNSLNKNKQQQQQQTNDVNPLLLKNDILDSKADSNNIVSNSGGITESVTTTNESLLVARNTNKTSIDQYEAEDISAKNRRTNTELIAKNDSNKANLKNNQKKDIENQETVQTNIRDTGIDIPDNDQKESINVNKKGSYIKVGNDTIGQTLSPRKSIKLSFAVFTSSKKARYTDFHVYAVPKNAEINYSSYYLIGFAKNIDVINNQSQYTRYWNGMNFDGDFFADGRYNIYLAYSIKDAYGNLLVSSGRFWGKSQGYFVKLY